MKWIARTLVLLAVVVSSLVVPGVRAAENTPSLKELQELLKANLVDADDASLNRAAVEGLLQQLSGLVTLSTNSQSATGDCTGVPLAKTGVYDDGFGYLRVGCVGGDLVKQLTSAMEGLSSSNKIKGWVVDLRYAGGSDYKVAAAVADRFTDQEQALLDCGQGMIRSAAKENTVRVPVLVLINRQTSKAAEALAAMLRKVKPALLLGTNTAGHAFVFKELPLKDGQFLRVAASRLRLGDGAVLSRQGVKPDIFIGVSPADEQAYFQDPYKQIALSSPVVGEGSGGDSILAGSSTNRASRQRLNEAELVRMLRDGGEHDLEGASNRLNAVARPVVRDPVLARAIDLLKGLSLVKASVR
jgi:hypothetical protein